MYGIFLRLFDDRGRVLWKMMIKKASQSIFNQKFVNFVNGLRGNKVKLQPG
jgi:hypothetical protein